MSMSSSKSQPDHWRLTRSSSPAPAQNNLAGPSQEVKSKGQYLDTRVTKTHRRLSLDSTYSEVSELAVHPSELYHAHQPLLSSLPRKNTQRLSYVSARHHHGIRGFLDAFWLRNKGVVLVLLAMVFGSGMNVTARLMETDGSHGKAMHPFQVSTQKGEHLCPIHNASVALLLSRKKYSPHTYFCD